MPDTGDRDLAEFRRLTREHAELTQLLERFTAYQQAEADLEAAQTRRKGLGRALLTYRRETASQTQPLGA